MSKTTFAALGVSATACRALADRGIETPFDVQERVLPDALAGRDVLVESPTGSGKTLAFALPLAQLLRPQDGPQTGLVLAPTRELAGQIVDDLEPLAQARGLRVAAVYGGVGIERQAKAARRAHIVVATPGRLIDLIERRAVNLSGVRIAVLDEADRMLDMGFKPAVDRILRDTPSDRQTLFFSATLEGAPQGFAAAYTRDASKHRVAARPERQADIEHRFVPVLHEAKLDALVATLHEEERGLAVVFVRTKRGADRLTKRLSARGVNAVAMHGDKSQGQRERALARFERGQVDTLIATDVAARGLDVADVTHVINFDAPDDRDGYVHRTGRTGRAGRSGTAITFVLREQERDTAVIASELGLHAELERAGLAAAAQARRRRAAAVQAHAGAAAAAQSRASRSRKVRRAVSLITPRARRAIAGPYGGSSTPASVKIAVTSSAGVTSKA